MAEGNFLVVGKESGPGGCNIEKQGTPSSLIEELHVGLAPSTLDDMSGGSTGNLAICQTVCKEGKSCLGNHLQYINPLVQYQYIQ